MDVVMVRWPGDESLRAELAERGHPRLLVVGPDADPPAITDPLEDWIRLPASRLDQQARMVMLAARAGGPITEEPPTIDADGLVRTRRGWVSVPPIEARLARLLIERYGRVVGRDELVATGWPDERAKRNALDVRILRLRKRLDEVGLVIRTIRNRGYLLESTPLVSFR